MSWTDERVEILKRLWGEGRSASEIAKELGEVTRNAVIGKVHRMGLKNHGTVETKAKPSAKKVDKPAPKAKVVKEPPVEKPVEPKTATPQHNVVVRAVGDEISEDTRRKAEKLEAQARKLGLMQLTERTCKWPIGDPSTEEFWFCGHPSQVGKPYCEVHVELAFQAPMSRRSRR